MDSEGYFEDGFSVSGWHRLHCAAHAGDLKAIAGALDAKADVDVLTRDFDLRTPLIRAAMWGQFEAMKLLLERKACVNATDSGNWFETFVFLDLWTKVESDVELSVRKR